MAKDLKPYVLLKPYDKVTGGGNQAHLFDFERYKKHEDGKSQPSGVSNDSICGMVSRNGNGYDLAGETDSEELRVKVAREQSKQDICGQCVARLYQ